MGLFDNTEMPRWITEYYERGRERTHESGMQAGRQIAAARQAGLNRQEEARQFDAMMPMRQQSAINETASVILRQQAQTAQQEVDNAKTAGMAAVSQTMADIARSGTWDKPQGREAFWKTVAAHPWVAMSPNFRLVEDTFDIADRAAAKANEASIKAASDANVATIRGQMTLLQQDLKNLGMEAVQDAKGQWSVKRVEAQAAGNANVATLKGEYGLLQQELRNHGLEAVQDAKGKVSLQRIKEQNKGRQDLQEQKDDAMMERQRDRYGSKIGDAERDAIKSRLEEIARRRVSLKGSMAKSPGKALLDFGQDNREIELEGLDREEKALREELGGEAAPAAAGGVPVIKSFNSNTGAMK